MDYSPPGSSVYGIFQARILGCHFFLQGIFPTQRWNPSLLLGFFATEPPGMPQSVTQLEEFNQCYRVNPWLSLWLSSHHVSLLSEYLIQLIHLIIGKDPIRIYLLDIWKSNQASLSDWIVAVGWGKDVIWKAYKDLRNQRRGAEISFSGFAACHLQATWWLLHQIWPLSTVPTPAEPVSYRPQQKTPHLIYGQQVSTGGMQQRCQGDFFIFRCIHVSLWFYL